MFSSWAPCSAFVDGVRRGSRSFSDSTRPVGSFIPWTVPNFLYSDHAEPNASISSIVNTTHTMRYQHTRNVTSYDRLHRNDLRLLYKHSSTGKLFLVLTDLFWHLIYIDRDKMVWYDMSQSLKPEKRDLCKESAFIWDSLTGICQLNGRQCIPMMLTLRRMTSYADILSVATKRRCSGDEVME